MTTVLGRPELMSYPASSSTSRVLPKSDSQFLLREKDHSSKSEAFLTYRFS